MKNLKNTLIAAGGLVLILIGPTFFSKNRDMGPSKEMPVEIKYTIEEQREIDYFNERARLIWFSYTINKPSLIEKSVCEMRDKYPNLNPKIQKAVKKYLEDGLFFLNGLYRRGNPKGFIPYQKEARALELDMNRIRNISNK